MISSKTRIISRRGWVWFGASFLFAVAIYAGVGSFFAQQIGRSSPGTASLFYPIWFNFAATYEDGRVLDFDIGESKENTISILLDEGYRVQPSCWGDNRAGGQDFYDREKLVSAMRQQDHICAIDGRVSLIFYFIDDELRKIRVVFIRNEII